MQKEILLTSAFDFPAQFADITTPSGKTIQKKGFVYQPIRFDYDEEGMERVLPDGEEMNIVRFIPEETGSYTGDL